MPWAMRTSVEPEGAFDPGGDAGAEPWGELLGKGGRRCIRGPAKGRS